MELRNKYNELEKEQEKLVDKENNAKKEIEKFLKRNKNIKDIEVYSSYSGKNINLNITPKSAWSDVINLIFKEDKIILNLSSGGWNKEENSFEEITDILNYVKENKDKIKELSNNILKIEKELQENNSKLSRVQDALKNSEKINLIKENGLIKINIDKLSKDKEYTIYYITLNSDIIPSELYFDSRSRRWRLDGEITDKKSIMYAYYIKEEEI